MRRVISDPKEIVRYVKRSYEAVGVVIELCKKCKLFSKFEYPEIWPPNGYTSGSCGPSTSSGMFCNCKLKSS